MFFQNLFQHLRRLWITMTTSLSGTKTLPSTTSSITSTQTTITSSITINDLGTSPQIGRIPLQILAKSMPYDPMKSRCWSIGSIVDSKNLAQRTNSGSITIDNKELVTQHEEVTSAISDEFNFLPYVRGCDNVEISYLGDPHAFPDIFRYIPLEGPIFIKLPLSLHRPIPRLRSTLLCPHPHATPLCPRRRQAPPLQVPTPILERSSLDE